jgi:hypothetical protein
VGSEVSGHELRSLVEDLGTCGYEFLVADLGAMSGDIPELLNLGMLVVVGTASPVGLTRLVRVIQRLLAGRHPEILAVVNRVATGGHFSGEIRSELNRSLPGTPLILLPSDPRIESAAWNGVIADRGRFHNAMKNVAGLLDEATRV